MIGRRKTAGAWLLGILALGPVSSNVLYAQCPWATGPACVPGSGPYSMCTREVIPSDGCFTAADGGAGTNCATSSMFTFGGTMVYLMATQTMASLQAGAYCEWGCGAATCRIQLSDGLPVELMDFSIEDSEAGRDD